MIPLLGPILNIVDKFVPDSDKKLELQKEIERNKARLEGHFAEYAKQEHELRIKEITHTGFKAWWRPAAMASLTFILSIYLILTYLVPPIITMLDINIWYMEPVELPEIIWYVYMGCMLGLGALRTYDKRR